MLVEYSEIISFWFDYLTYVYVILVLYGKVAKLGEWYMTMNGIYIMCILDYSNITEVEFVKYTEVSYL